MSDNSPGSSDVDRVGKRRPRNQQRIAWIIAAALLAAFVIVSSVFTQSIAR